DIDEEVRSILDTAYQRAKAILTENFDKVQKLAETLIEIETLDRAQFEKLMSTPVMG
ncbi:MAG TPA: hypothetical protein IGS52_09760, partial [Oscillatoriaceae cyanobacterium M33_DOE_052]|nr:hypothetical protein [Oscillatoriaceae cyanobacterium M33_DOE_052]